MTGFEPVTSSLPRKRSTPELHRRKVLNLFLQEKIPAFAGKYERRPGSNRRHSAWKADALPTELLPLIIFQNYYSDNTFNSVFGISQGIFHFTQLSYLDTPKLCGESRIRTYEVERQRSYSPPQLAALVSPQHYFYSKNLELFEPIEGLEPTTC